MFEYVSKACPFCGGTQIHRDGNAYICAYCLQPLDVSSGVLSDGYNKLASFNFAGALSFFREMTATAGEEAFYGMFLAQYKIVENKGKGDVRPVVFGYYPASFYENEEYKQARRLCAKNAALLKKLDKIEEARASTLTPQNACDVLVFCDGGGRERATLFANELDSRGQKTLVCETCPDIATLRAARAAYGFFEQAQNAEELLRGNARYFALLENERTAFGTGKRPIKIACAQTVGDLFGSGTAYAAQFVADIESGAEARRLCAVSGGEISFALPARSACAVLPVRRTDFIPAEADLPRVQRLLQSGDYTGALRQAERMSAQGEGSAALYFCGYLACARKPDARALAATPDEYAFTPAALAYAHEALYRCNTYEDAKPYIEALVQTALRCIDRKFIPFAARAVDVAFGYDFADDYAETLLSRLHAAQDGLPPAEAFSLGKKILDKLSSSQDGSRVKYALQIIDDALKAGEWELADDCVESMLDRFPSRKELYERKLLCANRVRDLPALYAVAYPRLGENFAYCLALSPAAEREKRLRDTFVALMKSAAQSGFKARQEAIDEALALGQVKDLFPLPLFSAKEYCDTGDLALGEKDFDAANAYYAASLSRDKKCYRAYWGCLLAALGCENDKKAEESATAVDETGGWFDKAYACAYGVDDAFIARIEGVRARQRETERKDGHVFRKSDFVLRGGVVVRYIGNGTDKVYVSGGAYKIGDGAFRGADVNSLLLGAGVTEIGDGAFAYSDLQEISLPDGVAQMGANPFCGCNGLKKITAAGNVCVQNGGVYLGDRLVSFVPSLAAGDTFAVRKNTATVGDRALYNVHEGSFDFGNARLEPCALYGCEGARLSANVSARTARTGESVTGESVTGGGVLTNGRIAASGVARWAALYGDGANNMAAGGDAVGDGRIQVKKIADTPRLTGGILIKNDRAIYAAENALHAVSLANGATECIRLPGECASTGVLWSEYVVQPTVGADGTVLCFVAPSGKTEYTVTLPARLTRPLCLCADTLLCIGGNELFAVHLPTAKVTARTMHERITSVPCAVGGRFVLADEKNVYALDMRLHGDGVHVLSGGNYAVGQGKICRGRIVGYKGVAYWVERTDANVCLGMFNGSAAGKTAVPRRIADFLQTQPVFYEDTLYAGGNTHWITAPIASLTGEWTFRSGAPVAGRYAEIAVIGGVCYCNSMEGEYGNMRLRAIADGKAILTDIHSGGIYAARI